MKEYNCDKCGKKFSQKSNWVQHTQERKKPCVKKEINLKEIIKGVKEDKIKEEEIKEEKINKINNINVLDKVNIDECHQNNNKKKFCCQYCLKLFTRTDNLKRHINNDKCHKYFFKLVSFEQQSLVTWMSIRLGSDALPYNMVLNV